MRTSDSPYLADWFAISLRWLSLLGLTAGLAIAGELQPASGAIILFGAIWNLVITILAILNRRLPFHRPLNLLADLTLTLFLYNFNGGLFGSLPWSSVITLFTAAIYYEIRGGLAAALVVSLLEGGLMYQSSGQAGLPLGVGFLTVANLLLGLIMGLVSNRLMSYIREVYQGQLRQRKEAERKVLMSERNRVQTFMNLVETISSTLNYRVVLDTVLDLSATALGGSAKGTDEMVSVVLLFGEHDLRVEAARHLSSHDMKHTFPAESGVLREVLQNVERQLIHDPTADPELRQILALSECKSLLVIPLNRAMSAYGMMLFGHPAADFFDEDRCELLEMVGHQAVIAIQNARLYQDLQEDKERIVQTQEEAGKKLARDLHDGPIQSVAAIAMRVDVARHMLARDTAEAANELVKIEELARRTTKELRHMLFTLRPLALETEGLASALQTMADKTRDMYQQNVKIEVDPSTVEQLELGKQTVIFYLVDEAVNNARKHARASQIMVRLRYLPQDVNIALLEIMDNGQGFDVQEVLGNYDKRGSLGMVNLRERTDLVNGLLNIESAPGKGTRIRVFIPLNEEAADRLQRGKVAK